MTIEEATANKKSKKVVIVGGVAGGASCAARLRRLDEHAEIVLLQRDPDVSYASCGMPYYIGGEITDRKQMAVQTPKSLRDRLNLDVRVNTSVVEIKPNENKLVCVENDGGSGGKSDDGKKKRLREYEESYDELVLAVGARPLEPPIPGINTRPGLFSLRNLQDMDRIAEWIERKKKQENGAVMHCVVAGAGFVGLEMVEQLVNRGMKVTLVELMKQILGPIDEEMAAYLHRDLEERGVKVVVGDGIKEFTADDKDVDLSVVKLQSGRILPPAHLTILGLGVRPDTEVVKAAGIEVGPRGHIIVNDHLQTSVPNIFAAGDSVLVKNPIISGETWAVPLAGPANRQGRMVADNIVGKKMRSFKGTYGVSVVRSFDLLAACCGMNEKMLSSKKIPYTTVHIHPSNHAGYYPNAQRMHLKLIFDQDSGNIYGAQAVGKGNGIEKRIDVIATAMQGGLAADDLAELELCYAPPVGSAKDPVNFAGMVAQDVMEGLVSQIEWNELETVISKENGDALMLDVRGPGEIAKDGSVAEGSINIPLNDLRRRIGELPTDKHILITCFSGQRAYYACRILMQSGFDRVHNLDGGYATFHPVHPDPITRVSVAEILDRNNGQTKL